MALLQVISSNLANYARPNKVKQQFSNLLIEFSLKNYNNLDYLLRLYLANFSVITCNRLIILE